ASSTVIHNTITSAMPRSRPMRRSTRCKREPAKSGLWPTYSPPRAGHDAQRYHHFGPGRTDHGLDANAHGFRHFRWFLPVVLPCRIAVVVLATQVAELELGEIFRQHHRVGTRKVRHLLRVRLRKHPRHHELLALPFFFVGQRKLEQEEATDPH